MAVRHIAARTQATDTLGKPAPLAKLRFYDAGTTNPRTVYSDNTRLVAILQPVVADAAGFFPQIYLQDGAYKYTLHSSADVLLDTEDNVDPGLSTGVGALAISAGGTSATTPAGARSALGAASQVALDALDLRVADAENLLDNPILAASVSITYAASISPDFTADETRHVILTGPLTLGAATVTAGQRFRFIPIQDATGGRTWSVNSAYKFAGGYVPPLSTTPNAVDVLEGYARTTGELQVTSFKRQDPLTNVAVIEDQQTQNTNGGTFTSGADRTRTLNTVVSDLTGIVVSLSSDQFTLRAGTYKIYWSAPAFACAGHQSLLYNVTDSSAVKRGSSAFNDGSDSTTSYSMGSAIVVISSNKAFEVRHRCATTRSTDGLGKPANVGAEVYTRVEIEKVA